VIRLKAAWHEMRCWECRVTWTSWAQRLVGLKRGQTPKMSKRHRYLVEQIRRAERRLDDRKADLLDALGMDPMRDWDDIVNATRCLREQRDERRQAAQ
jgi:hypothetical protein